MTSRMIDAVARIAKKSMPGFFWKRVRGYGTAIVTPFRFAFGTGHWKSSVAGRAVSPQGEPLPWYTYPAIDFLKKRDFAGKRILEFGAGQSTLWWAARSKEVVSIEADPDWERYVAAHAPANTMIRHFPIDRATRSVGDIADFLRPLAPFDVIVVDGHLRPELTELAFDLLAPNGAIINDNSDWPKVQEAVRRHECSRIDFYGFAPGVKNSACTSLVFVGDCFLLDPGFPVTLS
jgi:predicted O-methyltransferase YrrM